MIGGKLLNWITPLMLGMVLALVWIIYGVLHADKEYNSLYFVAGIPLLLVCVGLHLLILRLTKGNPLVVWGVELLLVGGVAYRIWGNY